MENHGGAGRDDALLARAYLYLLFHKLFGGYPDARLVDVLLGDATRCALKRQGDDNVLEAFVRHLSGLAGRERAGLLKGLQNEFTRMFVGPMALPAYPYESPYLTNEATLFQENTEQVREVYRAQGLLPRGYLHVPDDHIALMCDFMARLARAAYRANREGDAAGATRLLDGQASFVRAHMAGWVPEYAIQLRIMRSALLYPQAVEALAAFVRVDARFLDAALSGPAAGQPGGEGVGGAVDASAAEADDLRELERAYHELGMLQLEHLDGYELDRVST